MATAAWWLLSGGSSAWALQQDLVYALSCDGRDAGEFRVTLRQDDDGHRFVDLEGSVGADVRWGRFDATVDEGGQLGHASHAAVNVDGHWTKAETRLDSTVGAWGVYVDDDAGHREVGYRSDAITLSSLDLFDVETHRGIFAYAAANLLLPELGLVVRGKVDARQETRATVGGADLQAERMRFHGKSLAFEAVWLTETGHLARLGVDWMGHHWQADLKAVPLAPNFGTVDGTVKATGMTEEEL